MNDPLGANVKRDPLSKNGSNQVKDKPLEKNKAKEFEQKLAQESQEMLGGKEGQANQIFKDEPRKLLFRTNNTNQQQQQPQQSQQQTVSQNVQPHDCNNNNTVFFNQEKQVLDIKTCGLKDVLPGEILRRQQQVTLVLQQNIVSIGTIYVTNYKIIFDPAEIQYSIERKETFTLPLGFICRVDRVIEKKPVEIAYLDIQSKDGRAFKFRFQKEQFDESQILWSLIYKSAFVENKKQLFAFTHYFEKKEQEEKFQGWEIYKIKQEFDRQGIFIASVDRNEQSLFKYADNKSGQICETYGDFLVVPYEADNDCILKTSKFRTKERLPILAYAFKNGEKTVSLWRSSQCKSGIGSNRCQEDEMYLKLMAKQTIDNTDGTDEVLKIFDARPYLNALGMQVAGKGFENLQVYKWCTIEFLDIHNIHKIRDSYKKLLQLALHENNLTVSSMGASGWYDHLITLIQGAVKIASSLKMTKKKQNVLIHCSDGWDRTAQLSSLVQIMLDPYFRTIKGLMVLIQKDWVYAGHQFATRSGTGNKHHGDEQRAPIFILFLDAIYQLLHFYPLSFEFNHRLLGDLAFHYHSALYGTFLCDSYLELQRFQVTQCTISIWSKIMEHRDQYLNPFYKTPNELNSQLIIPTQFSARQITFWKEHFTYFSIGSLDHYQIYPDVNFNSENIQQLHIEIKKENQVLRQAQSDQETFLQQQLLMVKELKKLIDKDPKLRDEWDQVEQNLIFM